MKNMNKLHAPYDNILSNKFENDFDSAKIGTVAYLVGNVDLVNA